MIKSFDGTTPRIPASAFVSQTALVMGRVRLGEYCGVWPGAVIRGDFADIEIASHVIIEDNTVIHGGATLTIGEHTIIGHGAVVHCRSIGDHSLIANNATLLDDAEIGSFCIIGAGCVVSPGMMVPDGSLVFGIPGKIAGPVKPHQRERLERGNDSYIEMFQKYRIDDI